MPREKQMIAHDRERFPDRATRHSERILIPSREQSGGGLVPLILSFFAARTMHLPTSIGMAKSQIACLTLARQPAATGIPFGRKGADSFARGIDGSNTFPSGTGSVSRVFSAAVRCRIGRLGMIGSRSRTLWS
jgi:hypothetical protein